MSPKRNIAKSEPKNNTHLRYNTGDEVWIKGDKVIRVKTYDGLYWEEGYGFEPANWFKRMWRRYATTDIVAIFLLIAAVSLVLIRTFVFRR